jgi:hypothetical protein
MNVSDLATIKLELVISLLSDVTEFTQTFPGAQVNGKGKLGDLDVYVLNTTLSNGRVETFYFDAHTGLLVKRDSVYDDPNKKEQK